MRIILYEFIKCHHEVAHMGDELSDGAVVKCPACGVIGGVVRSVPLLFDLPEKFLRFNDFVLPPLELN